jgi:hypothetical protein
MAAMLRIPSVIAAPVAVAVAVLSFSRQRLISPTQVRLAVLVVLAVMPRLVVMIMVVVAAAAA